MKYRGKRFFAALWFVVVMVLCGCGADIDAVVGDTPITTKEKTEMYLETETKIPETKVQETEPETKAQDINREVVLTISAAGDVTLGNTQNQGYAGTFREMYDDKEPAYFFQNVKDIFSKDDFTLVNFEGVLTFAEEKMDKEYNMKGDPSYIEILTAGNVEGVSFGNNHRMDYYEVGSDDTIKAFEEAELAYAYDYTTGIYTVQDIKIGFVSVNEVYEHKAVEKYLETGIKNLKEEGCHLVIACCHWGIERDFYPNEYQKELGKKCIDWGADLVLGSHPHVLQGVEEYGGGLIVYSLANFCFGGNRNPKDKDCMIFQQTFRFLDGVKQEGIDAKVIPCSVSSVKTRNDFCPTPATGEEYERILERINLYSEPFNLEFDIDGVYQSSMQSLTKQP